MTAEISARIKPRGAEADLLHSGSNPWKTGGLLAASCAAMGLIGIP
jgi:hypothetical protein